MEDFRPLLTTDLAGWRMAGPGGFRWAEPGVLESFGGSGLFWFADAAFEDFVLKVEWRITRPEDNSGVFIRCPPLQDSPGPAIERGYEIQIDDRGYDPKAKRLDSPLHLTGAIYRLAPASGHLSRPCGEWNEFVIRAEGDSLTVWLNGTPASHLRPALREPRGHIALQNHHEGSAVQFRRLDVMPLERPALRTAPG